MNKKFIIIGSLLVVTLAGCQNIADQMTKKLVEGVVNTASEGEVKIDLKDLEKGQFSLTTKEGVMDFSGDENGGSMKVTDGSGKVIMDASSDGSNVVVNGEDGKALINGVTGEDGNFNIINEDGSNLMISSGENADRPKNVPDDMPSLNNGKDFAFMNIGENQMLTYTIKDSDYLKVCEQQIELLNAKGWEKASVGFNVTGDNLQMSTMTQGERNMSITCSAESENVRVNLSTSKM